MHLNGGNSRATQRFRRFRSRSSKQRTT